MTEKLKSLFYRDDIRQILRYVMVGGLTTLVNLMLFYLLDKIAGMNTTAANALSVIASVLFAYAANKLFVFRSRGLKRKVLLYEMLSFFSARAATMLLEVGGVFLMHDIIGIDSMVSKIVLNVIVIILNYVFSKLFVFTK